MSTTSEQEEMAPLPDKQETIASSRTGSCCSSWFQPRHPKTQRTLDIAQSFAPSTPLAIVVKVLVTALVVGTWIRVWIKSNHPSVLLAFLTQWAYLCLCLYTTSSLLNSVLGGVLTSSSWRVRTSWVLFELGVHLTTLASVGYYAFVFDPSKGVSYVDIATHGGVLPFVIIEGLVINRIPFRWIHYWGIILPIGFLYAAWTYIHSLTDIGNPGLSNSDFLYPGSLEWTSEGWVKTTIITVLLLLVVGPISFLAWWSLANGHCCCRDISRYVEEHDEEEASPPMDEKQTERAENDV